MPASFPSRMFGGGARSGSSAALFPPIDLFEDIADPADWPLLIAAEQKTNPRLMEIDRRSRPGAARPAGRRRRRARSSWRRSLMSAPSRPSRFGDGVVRRALCRAHLRGGADGDHAPSRALHGAHRGGAGVDIAIPRDRSRYRGRLCTICGAVIATYAPLLDPDDYAAQPGLRAANAAGAVRRDRLSERPLYRRRMRRAVLSGPSPRNAVQGRHLDYHWNGERVDLVRDLSAGQVFRVVP